MRIIAAYLKDWDRLQSSDEHNFNLGGDEFTLLDFGGTLGARARGGLKPGNVHSNAIGTFETTQDIDQIYGSYDVSWLPPQHPWRNLTAEDAQAVIERFQLFTDEKIEAIVRSAQYTDSNDHRYMVNALRQRRDGIINNLLSRFPAERRKDREPIFPFSPEPAPDFDPAKIDAQTIERRVFAVHATEFMPPNGVMRAGASDISGAEASVASEPPSFRPTIHFTLGELVRDHHRFSWEDRPYAVVLPLGSLKNQLININAYDTYILGDFELPPEAIFVIPAAQAHQAPQGVRVETYDAGSTNLRGAVDGVIEKYGGWHIEMTERDPSLDSIGKIGDQNVNTVEFFDPFLQENPHVSFGSHIESQVGTAFRFGVIEQATNILMKGFGSFGMGMGTAERIFLLHYARFHLAKLAAEIEAGGWLEISTRIFQEKWNKALQWLNIVDADLELRKNYEVTLERADEQIVARATALRDDPEALNQYLKGQRTRLQRAKNQNGLAPGTLSLYLSSLPVDEMREITQEIRAGSELTPADIARMDALYALRRLLTLSAGQARAEGLFGLLESSLSQLSEETDVFNELFQILEPYLDNTSSRMERALEILRLPSIRGGLESHFGFKMPSVDRMGLEDFLRVFPETRDAYAQAVALPNTTAGRILQKLNRRKTKEEKREFESHSAARSAAWSHESAVSTLKENLEAINRPMRSTRDSNSIRAGDRLGFYELMQRGDYGSLDEVWEKLGLRAKFRRKFSQDRKFWQSDKSLVEIYEMLSE